MQDQQSQPREIIAPDTSRYADLTEQASFGQWALSVLGRHPGAVDLAALGTVYGLCHVITNVPGWVPYVCVVVIVAISVVRQWICRGTSKVG